MVSLSQAAQARSGQVRRMADRPTLRRAGEHPEALQAAYCRHAVQVRSAAAGPGSLHFTGYASVTGRGYDMWDMFGPYTELVTPGAFESSLARADLDVPLVLAHDSLRRIARTTTGTLLLAEDDEGLRCDAPSLDPADADVAYITPKLVSGLVDEMSFRFQITSGEWSPDWTEYHIDSVEIHRGDVAIVGYGANPMTSGSLRAAVEKISHKRALDPADVSVITQALGWFASIDAIADEAAESLASYVGATNVDPDEQIEAAQAAVALIRERRLSALRTSGSRAMSFAELLAI